MHSMINLSDKYGTLHPHMQKRVLLAFTISGTQYCTTIATVSFLQMRLGALHPSLVVCLVVQNWPLWGHYVL